MPRSFLEKESRTGGVR